MEQTTKDLGLVAGANLKRLLKEKGKTQDEFAAEIYVSERTIRRWIKFGINDVRDIQRIADFFNVGVETVLFE